MRKNRRLRGFDEEEETKKIVYISIAVVVIAILTFAITYVIYSNALNKNSEDLTSKISQISSEANETSYETSSHLEKDVNQVQEETEKIAINTANMKEETEKVEIKKQETPTNETKKQEVAKTPTFIKPVEGEIIKEFSMENLIYSETLKEWIVHNGIDIKADKTTIVKASSEGTIKSIKNDPRYGITVIIEHSSGFISIYSNLLTAEFVKEGEDVKQGQTIGTVGNSASFEIADEPHLHFEILKNNEYLNPSEYIK